jgi:hypothetical protein
LFNGAPFVARSRDGRLVWTAMVTPQSVGRRGDLMIYGRESCGCRCAQNGTGDWTIARCALHEAAPRLLDALKHFVDWDIEADTALKIARDVVAEIDVSSKVATP